MRPVQSGFERFLSLTRFVTLIPVVFLLIDAAASFIYGSDIMVRSTTGLIGAPAKVGGRLGLFLIVMDTFLVGATLMVAAWGFYELFIMRKQPQGRRYWLPGWLRMHDLEDLKGRVVSMLILVAAITFVDRTVESHDEEAVLFLGLGISIIILALTFFLWLSKRNGSEPGADGLAVARGSGPDPVSGGSGNGGMSSTTSGATAGPAGGGPTSGPAGGDGRASRGHERKTGSSCDRPVSPRERYCASRSTAGEAAVRPGRRCPGR